MSEEIQENTIEETAEQIIEDTTSSEEVVEEITPVEGVETIEPVIEVEEEKKLEIRNARYVNEEKTYIDVEINHPQYGWIPYLFVVNQEDKSFDKDIREQIEDGSLDIAAYEAPQLTVEQQKDQLKTNVQNFMDYTATQWGYDNIYTAIGYIGDPYEQFDKEGQMFRNWRSAVWVYVNQELAKLQQGLRQLPTEDEAIAELPLLETFREQLGL